MKEKLENPYQKCTDVVRLSADIPYETREFLQSVYPHRGLFQNLINTWIHHIEQELHNANVTPPNPSLLVDIVRRITFKRPIGVGHGVDVGTTNEGVPHGVQEAENVSESVDTRLIQSQEEERE